VHTVDHSSPFRKVKNNCCYTSKTPVCLIVCTGNFCGGGNSQLPQCCMF